MAAIERGGYWAQALSLTINHVPSSALDGLVATARSQLTRQQFDGIADHLAAHWDGMQEAAQACIRGV